MVYSWNTPSAPGKINSIEIATPIDEIAHFYESSIVIGQSHVPTNYPLVTI